MGFKSVEVRWAAMLCIIDDEPPPILPYPLCISTLRGFGGDLLGW